MILAVKLWVVGLVGSVVLAVSDAVTVAALETVGIIVSAVCSTLAVVLTSRGNRRLEGVREEVSDVKAHIGAKRRRQDNGASGA